MKLIISLNLLKMTLFIGIVNSTIASNEDLSCQKNGAEVLYINGVGGTRDGFKVANRSLNSIFEDSNNKISSNSYYSNSALLHPLDRLRADDNIIYDSIFNRHTVFDPLALDKLRDEVPGFLGTILFFDKVKLLNDLEEAVTQIDSLSSIEKSLLKAKVEQCIVKTMHSKEECSKDYLSLNNSTDHNIIQDYMTSKIKEMNANILEKQLKTRSETLSQLKTKLQENIDNEVYTYLVGHSQGALYGEEVFTQLFPNYHSGTEQGRIEQENAKKVGFMSVGSPWAGNTYYPNHQRFIVKNDNVRHFLADNDYPVPSYTDIISGSDYTYSMYTTSFDFRSMSVVFPETVYKNAIPLDRHSFVNFYLNNKIKTKSVVDELELRNGEKFVYKMHEIAKRFPANCAEPILNKSTFEVSVNSQDRYSKQYKVTLPKNGLDIKLDYRKDGEIDFENDISYINRNPPEFYTGDHYYDKNHTVNLIGKPVPDSVQVTADTQVMDRFGMSAVRSDTVNLCTGDDCCVNTCTKSTGEKVCAQAQVGDLVFADSCDKFKYKTLNVEQENYPADLGPAPVGGGKKEIRCIIRLSCASAMGGEYLVSEWSNSTNYYIYSRYVDGKWQWTQGSDSSTSIQSSATWTCGGSQSNADEPRTVYCSW